MNPQHIAPFISSVKNVFQTMLQLDVAVGDPIIINGQSRDKDVSGIIGMTGDVEGVVVLSFDFETAISTVSLFCGEPVERDSEDFSDAVGELCNMVCGGAKAGFPDNESVSISCPSVVIGSGHNVNRPADVPAVAVPCTTDCGEFVIEIAVRSSAGAVASDDAGAVAA
ncbi:MAG: chemotaxis protein CheX [Planctomycetota bacterium]